MSRTHHVATGEPTQRMLRVAELVRHAMSDLLARGEIMDPVIEKHVVTVPRVRMSPDLKLATVYVMSLGGKDTNGVLEALERHRKHLRKEIATKLNLKFAPDMRFREDDTFDNQARIDALLNNEKVRRDLDTAPDKDAD